MGVKLVPCPNCERVFHIKGHKQVTCICGNTFIVLRNRGHITLEKIKEIKTRPFKARKI